MQSYLVSFSFSNTLAQIKFRTTLHIVLPVSDNGMTNTQSFRSRCAVCKKEDSAVGSVVVEEEYVQKYGLEKIPACINCLLEFVKKAQ